MQAVSGHSLLVIDQSDPKQPLSNTVHKYALSGYQLFWCWKVVTALKQMMNSDTLKMLHTVLPYQINK